MNFYYSDDTFINYARIQAEAMGGFPGGYGDGSDNHYDAFRHALLSAKLTQYLGEATAKAIGDMHEADNLTAINGASTNMDYFNNDVGRKEFLNWKNAVDSNKTLEQWIYDVVKDSNKTINSLSDPRVWIEPSPPVAPGTMDTEGWTIDPETNSAYLTAALFRPRRDPLAIDLDNDGIETVGITATPVLFDHNADGIKTGTGWVAGDDAWLVLDRDGNGLIDSGRELFGVDTLLAGTAGAPNAVYASSGFEALKVLDTNNDNLFDANDTAFTQVRLWQDLNQDGVSQANELFTLTQKNIVSIGLAASTTTTNLGNGNTVSGTAVVTRSNGSTTLAETVSVGDDNTVASNLDLANNPFYRTFTTPIALTTQAQGLPEMHGSGWVRGWRGAGALGNRSTL